MTKQTFFLDQHGCAKNQVDGELLISHLTNAGYVRVDDASKADLIIINSCGFIQSAKQESLDAVMNARAAYPHAKILLAGCLAERYAHVFESDLPEADGIFGNGDLSQIVKTANDV
ncbi:MAG TPA: 30S ribosomal protein S12 methylthiotransferase RimO, partial [Treponema sp.]|nr:30S ribosomal protein S12 methylthiotransferase RimO [Treponema sp.]